MSGITMLFTMGSGKMRVPRTMGRPDALPGICSMISQVIQSIPYRGSHLRTLFSFHRELLP
jgi:hypothetical protein